MNAEHEERLGRLLSAYREACPDIEASPNFMPSLWSRIEAERPASWILPLRLWAARLVASATLATVLLIGYLGLLQHSRQSIEAFEQGYIDALTADARVHHEDDFWLAGNER